jgi:hypothetical protein
MTTTVTAATLIALLKDAPSISTAEACLMQAIDAINLEGLAFGVSVADLTGADLVKTGTYNGYEKAAIIQVATAVYSQNYKSSGASSSHSEGVGAGPLSYSTSDSASASTSGGGNSVINSMARDVVISLLKAQGRHFQRA